MATTCAYIIESICLFLTPDQIGKVASGTNMLTTVPKDMKNFELTFYEVITSLLFLE
jgi:hypothetical protein